MAVSKGPVFLSFPFPFITLGHRVLDITLDQEDWGQRTMIHFAAEAALADPRLLAGLAVEAVY
jgi:hypothetical protein